MFRAKTFTVPLIKTYYTDDSNNVSHIDYEVALSLTSLFLSNSSDEAHTKGRQTDCLHIHPQKTAKNSLLP